jgi:hypothetical protein
MYKNLKYYCTLEGVELLQTTYTLVHWKLP